MKLKKAIDLTEVLLINLDLEMEEDEKDALRLLIEAGKHLKRWRDYPFWEEYKPLPGEDILRVRSSPLGREPKG